MRPKVSSSNTGSDDSASSAAERASGVDAGLTAACDGLAGLAGLAATGGLAGAGTPCGAINVGWPATLPCASAAPDAAARTRPAIAIVRIIRSPSKPAILLAWRDLDQPPIQTWSPWRFARFEVISSLR